MSQSVIKKVILGRDENGIDISNRIGRIYHKLSTKKLDSVEFTATHKNAEYLLELKELNHGKPILFSYGYITGEQSPTYIAVINDLEPDYTNSGLILKIQCLDKGISLKNIGSKRIWKNMSTDQIVREIGKAHGFITEIQNTGEFAYYDSLPQGGRLDMDFLQYLARMEQNGNYVCYVSGKVLYFITRSTAVESIDKITVGKYENLLQFNIKYKSAAGGAVANGISTGMHNSQVSANVYEQTYHTPMGDFVGIKRDGVIYAKQPDGTYADVYKKQVIIDAKGQDTWVNTATGSQRIDSKDAAQILGVSVSTKSALGEATDLVESAVTGDLKDKNFNRLFGGRFLPADSPFQDPNEVLRLNNSKFKAAKYNVLTATLKEYGLPRRKVNTVITVDGVATRFIGNWFIESVINDVGDNNYVTTSELTKDGVKTGAVKSKEAANNSIGTDANANKNSVVIIQGRTGDAFQAPSADGKYISRYVAPNTPVKKPPVNNPTSRTNK